MIRLAIFDLDGTLIDSRGDIADAGNAARHAIGLPPLPMEAIVPMVGDGAGMLIERLTPDSDPAGRARAMAAFRADYATRLTARTTVYPGILATLATLRTRGWNIGIATNKPAVFAEPICRRLGLLHDALRGGEGPKKPDPAMLLALLAELGGRADQAWMIGDHHADLHAGAAAGLRTVHCTWGFGRRDGAPATAVANRAEDLLRILDG